MKQEQKIGKHGEQLARSVLSGLGLEMIEKIGTPVTLIKVESNKPNVFQVIFGEKVAGDHRAMLPDGTSVLIEVKTIYDRNLVWGDLRPHQPGKLQEHAQLNGISLLVWVNDSGVAVMRWPIAGFGPGKGINTTFARFVNDETVAYLQYRINSFKKHMEELSDY